MKQKIQRGFSKAVRHWPVSMGSIIIALLLLMLYTGKIDTEQFLQLSAAIAALGFFAHQKNKTRT